MVERVTGQCLVLILEAQLRGDGTFGKKGLGASTIDIAHQNGTGVGIKVSVHQRDGTFEWGGEEKGEVRGR